MSLLIALEGRHLRVCDVLATAATCLNGLVTYR